MTDHTEPDPTERAPYTPTTQKVREGYVRGLRQAFIASAGEHGEEFDRWLAEEFERVRADEQKRIAAAIEKNTAEKRNTMWQTEVPGLVLAATIARSGGDQ